MLRLPADARHSVIVMPKRRLKTYFIQRSLLRPQSLEILAMGRVRCAENFVRVLQGREEPLSDPSEAVKLMKIIDAIYASSRTGRPVGITRG